jgi:Mrp family chromosome partitioning ATPase
MVEGAQQGVLVVDCNSASPDLADRLGLMPRWGLSELLAKEVSRGDAIVASQVPHLFLLGRGRTTGDLSQPASLALFEEAVTGLRSAFDYLILDGGSLDSCPDSLLLASRVDGVVLVVRAERTGTESLREASSQLKRAGANVLGVVLNRRREYLPRFLSAKKR